MFQLDEIDEPELNKLKLELDKLDELDVPEKLDELDELHDLDKCLDEHPDQYLDENLD